MLAAALAVVPAFAQDHVIKLVVADAWLRKPPPGLDTAAVYFTVQNASKDAMEIVGVKTPLAAHAMIHETSTVGGQSRMRMRDTVPVPAGARVKFAPEGLHVMLSGLSKPLEVGDKVPLTLELGRNEALEIVAVVRPLDTK
jgi:periplasmic copper chaperone A